MNPELKHYIEQQIIPRYAAFDRAHRTDHVRAVIARSMELAEHYDVNPDMVYTVAAYHDTGLVSGREHHHTDSGKILTDDQELRRWFSEEQIATMRDAVEDHRASSDHEPRTIYGRIVAEADRLIDAATIIRRTIQYGLAHDPELDRQGHFDRCCEHMQCKYAEGGYLKLWIPESDNALRLAELRSIIRNRDQSRQWFDHIFAHETDPRLEACVHSFCKQTGTCAENLRRCNAFYLTASGLEQCVEGYLVNGEHVIDLGTHQIHSREEFHRLHDLTAPKPD